MCEKHCKKCSTAKSILEFGSDSSKKDKLRTVCKECSRKYDINRSKDPKRKAYMSQVILEYRMSGKAAESGKKYRRKYPAKYEAHKAVTTAIRNKKLVREACEACGCEESHAHHDNYMEKLTVRWLCSKHHNEWHKEHGEGLNAN